jgi:serine/threonine-protein kinase
VRSLEEEQRSTVIPPVRAGEGSARISLPATPLPASWTLRLGGELRPGLTYPEVIELLVTGRIPAETAQFSKEGSAFKPARDYPELSRFVTSPALAWTEHMPTGVIDRKVVDRALLPSRLYYLAVNRETGALLLQAGEKKKKIFFVDGIPEYAASTDRTELLGECLVRRGQVLRMEVDMALAMLSEFDGKLGDALVGLGVLRPIELFRAVLDQTQDRIVEAFSWTEGEVAFLPGARCQEETLPLGVKPFELIARGIREHYQDAELRDILDRIGNDAMERVTPMPVRVESFRLPPAEERVLLSVEGRITRSALEDRAIREGMASLEEVNRAIFFGLSCDVLRTPRWRGFASSHPRR